MGLKLRDEFLTDYAKGTINVTENIAALAQAPASASAAYMTVAQNIEATLAERGSRYGSFAGHAAIVQALKGIMQKAEGWERLAADQKEALEMTAHKIGRILNGDPNFHDSWHDIVGYIKLVADRLAGKAQP